MKIDVAGNLFATGPGGVFVFSPAGKHLGTIVTGEPTANCAFGDDGQTLYMTANDKLTRIRLEDAGRRRQVGHMATPPASARNRHAGTGPAPVPLAAGGGTRATTTCCSARSRMLILGPLGGVTSAYMNFSARASSSAARCWPASSARRVTYGYGAEGKHGAQLHPDAWPRRWRRWPACAC